MKKVLKIVQLKDRTSDYEYWITKTPKERLEALEMLRQQYIDYEKDITNGVIKHLYYISAGDGLIAIAERNNTTNTFHYAYTDHLGSIEVLTSNTAAISSQQSFDAWGRRRNPTNWTYSAIPAVQTWLKRGYTGHEHLNQFGLINMNGRMYDPVVGRMLSVDNNVQMPDFTQNYNRYSYALNNPLKYTDPSGEVFVFAIPSVNYGKQSGWEVSVTVGVGFPGALSVQATVGHNFKSDNTYITLGATAGGLTISGGYGTATGWTASAGFGFGFPVPGVSTNITSFGVSWSENGGVSANAFGLNYSRGGFGFNPSIGYSTQINVSEKGRVSVPIYWASIGGDDIQGGTMKTVEIIDKKLVYTKAGDDALKLLGITGGFLGVQEGIIGLADANFLGSSGTKYLNFLKIVGKGIGVVGIAEAGYQLYQNPYDTSSQIKLLANILILARVANPFAGAALTISEASGLNSYLYLKVGDYINSIK